MKLHYPFSYDRKEIARLISSLLIHPRHKDSSGCPYMPNSGDDSFWTLDTGNDWKVLFKEDRIIELYHRYSSQNHKVEILANWLVARFGFEMAE